MAFTETLRRLLGRDRPEPRPETGFQIARFDVQPHALYAIGDVHGCLPLLRELELKIAADIGVGGQAVVVLLGDMVDRGPQTAQLLDYLLRPAATGMQRLMIMGNHELMMLEFLRRPDPNADWLSHGGLETLLSYGIPREEVVSAPRRRLTQLVESYVPIEHIELIEGLLLYVDTPRALLVHAGIAEGVPLEQQRVETFTGYRDKFAATYDDFGRIVVHGHMIRSEPLLMPHRIAIDTGAYATGRLTAVRLRNGEDPAVFSAVANNLAAGVD